MLYIQVSEYRTKMGLDDEDQYDDTNVSWSGKLKSDLAYIIGRMMGVSYSGNALMIADILEDYERDVHGGNYDEITYPVFSYYQRTVNNQTYS